MESRTRHPQSGSQLPKQATGWHCPEPKCQAGIASSEMSKYSMIKVRDAKWKHAKQRHGVESRTEWKRQQQSRANAGVTQQRSIRMSGAAACHYTASRHGGP